MKNLARLALVFTLIGLSLAATGCRTQDEYDTCVRRNDTMRQRIENILAEQDKHQLRTDMCQDQLKLVNKENKILQERTTVLTDALAAKNALLAELTSQFGQIALPVELSNALAEWALQTGPDLVTFDEVSGIVRFKSDLLFDKGSDVVQEDKKELLKKLAPILNSSVAQAFDVLVVGHTDDMRLGPATRARHYSNWHLSAHRAIAVKTALTEAELAQTRVAIMGMGEHRPIEPNKPNKGGNPNNRRVEIYIIPAGQMTP